MLVVERTVKQFPSFSLAWFLCCKCNQFNTTSLILSKWDCLWYGVRQNLWGLYLYPFQMILMICSNLVGVMMFIASRFQVPRRKEREVLLIYWTHETCRLLSSMILTFSSSKPEISITWWFLRNSLGANICFKYVYLDFGSW